MIFHPRHRIYSEQYIKTTDTHEGFPLSKLLLLISTGFKGRYFHISHVKLLGLWLEPISLIELDKYPIIELEKFQSNWILIGTADKLNIHPGQLFQLWNDVTRDNKVKGEL